MSSEEIRSSGMNDDKLVDEHVRLNEIKHEPTKGSYKHHLSLFRLDVFFVCSIQLAHTNDFALTHLRKQKNSLPTKEDLRKEKKSVLVKDLCC